MEARLAWSRKNSCNSNSGNSSGKRSSSRSCRTDENLLLPTYPKGFANIILQPQRGVAQHSDGWAREQMASRRRRRRRQRQRQQQKARQLHINTYNMSCSLPVPCSLDLNLYIYGLCARCYANMFLMNVYGCVLCVACAWNVCYRGVRMAKN